MEMQVYYDEFYGERTLLYCSQLDAGEDYSKLCPCISVNIVDYIAFKDHNDFHSKFEMWDADHNNKLTNKMAIHFFELKKVKGELDKNDRKKLWLLFLKAETKEEFTMLEHIGVLAIEKAVQAIYTISADEKKKEDIRMREKALHDQTSMLASAERRGEARGRAEGRADLLSEMIADGVPEEIIKKYLN